MNIDNTVLSVLYSRLLAMPSLPGPMLTLYGNKRADFIGRRTKSWWPSYQDWRGTANKDSSENPPDFSHIDGKDPSEQKFPDQSHPSEYSFSSHAYDCLVFALHQHTADEQKEIIESCFTEMKVPSTLIKDCLSSDDIAEFIISHCIEEAHRGTKSQKALIADTPRKRTMFSAQKRFLTFPSHLPPFSSRSEIVCRDAILDTIEKQLVDCEFSKILLYGFGGIGKTSILKLLFTEFSSKYDYIGWIQYHGTFMDSFLEQSSLCNHISDPRTRWDEILHQLELMPGKKLLLVDNVDKDSFDDLSPQTDQSLQSITSLSSTTVIITSRLNKISGYQVIKIPFLTVEECTNLFFRYYPSCAKTESVIQSILNLISIVKKHTFSIELLAKAAQAYPSIEEFTNNISKLGLAYPTWQIASEYTDNVEEKIANQLQKVFNVEKVSITCKETLWCISLLPEGMLVPTTDIKHCFSDDYFNALGVLIRDGWLSMSNGYITMHPIIRTIIHFGLKDRLAPEGIAADFVASITDQTLFLSHRSDLHSELSLENHEDVTFRHDELQRKLQYAESVVKYYHFENECEKADCLRSLGNSEFKHARKRITAIKYLEETVKIYDCTPHINPFLKTAPTLYELGYLKSTTQDYRANAQVDLRRALSIFENEPDSYRLDIAKIKDHLGYVLSDNVPTQGEAKRLLLSAYSTLSEIENTMKANQEQIPDWLNYNISTVCDNIGALLSKSASEHGDAETFYQRALLLREDLYSKSITYATDVAWTAYNLGVYLSSNENRLNDAKTYLERSLKLRRELDNAKPGNYTNNIILTLISLAKLHCQIGSPCSTIQPLYNEAVQLKTTLDDDHTGFFAKDVDVDIEFIHSYLNNLPKI